MRERYCFEHVPRVFEDDNHRFFGGGWAIIDRRQGYKNPIGYILEPNMAKKIVDYLNSGVADARVQPGKE